MKHCTLLLFLICVFFSSRAKRDFEDKKNASNTLGSNVNSLQDSLAFVLCQIYGADQTMRHLKPSKWKVKVAREVDTANYNKIKEFIHLYGLPNKELVGEEDYKHECVHAALAAVLLHNPHRLVNEKEELNFYLAEVNKGNLKREFLAAVLDKYYWIKRDEYGNKKLLYGSQFGKPCSYNRVKSDSARAVIGLPPLPDSMFVECKTIPPN